MTEHHPVSGPPCGSCPMRLEAPSGLWAPEEYEKLPAYDEEIGYQPTNLFLCHQKTGDLCGGWVAVGGDNLLALKIAAIEGRVDPDVFDYRTRVPLHPSFTASADHGMRDVDAPSPQTVRVARRLVRKGVALERETR